MRRKLVSVCLAAALALCCAGCGGEQAGEGTEYALYFLQRETMTGSAFSTAERVRVPEDDPEITARRLAGALLEGTAEAELYSPFRPGTRILSCVWNNGVITLSLSEEYGQLEGIELTAAEYALTLTLCQIPQVEGVRVLLEGRQIPVTPSGILTPEQAVQSGEVFPEDPENGED